MNAVKRFGIWCSNDCSVILRNVNICSLQERPVLKAAWFLRSFRSISFFSQQYPVKSFLAMVSNVMPLQLSQSHNDLFLGIFTIHLLVHSFGTSSELQMTIASSVSFSMIKFRPSLKSSAGKLSIPDALLFFNCLTKFVACDTIENDVGVIVIDVILICGVEERVRVWSVKYPTELFNPSLVLLFLR